MEFRKVADCCRSALLGLTQLLVVLAVVQASSSSAGYDALNRTATMLPPGMMPAVIAFGDSIVDPGNNDVLVTIIKCNFPPYGQDFAGGPTGRFSNGYIPTDLIAQSLGVKELIPPYLGVDLSPQDILTGVSFASGATGYDPLTSKILNVISMKEQLRLFAEYKARVSDIAGPKRGAEIISQALYVVCAGTDDLANTYFTSPFRKNYDIPSYVDLLISSAQDFLEKLAGMGARRIAFVGLPPVGCLPSQRTLAGGISRQCEESRNQAALLYNSKIQEVLQGLQVELGGGAKVVYADIYYIILDLVQRPAAYGFKESTKGCCGTGEIEVTLLCNSKTATTCSDASEYVFWDSYHPTEKAYRVIVDDILKKCIKLFL